MAKNTIHYIGTSMFPTLKTGDFLSVAPLKDRNIRIGDVVVFNSPYGNKPIVHRVVSIDKKGIKTKGDNNNNMDDWVLCIEDIIGRVACVSRKNRTKTIYGGLAGRIYASGLRAIKQIDLTVSKILHPVYHRLAHSGIFINLLPQQLKTQILCFRRPNGIEMQLLMGKRVIGRQFPGQNQWHIVRPFKLFIDESTLP